MQVPFVCLILVKKDMGTKQRFRYINKEKDFHAATGFQKEDYFIPISKFETKVRVQSSGQGEPVLFIPGGPNCGTVWTELVCRFTNYHCLLLDRPGTGLSDPISYQNLDNGRLSDIITTTIDEVLQYFNLSQINVIGSSFGGYWALKYSVHRPEKVKRLVLEGCPAFIEGFRIPPFMKIMTKPLMKWLIPKLPTTLGFSKKLLMDMGHTPEVINSQIPKEYFNWYISMCNNTITLKNDLQVINKAMKGGKVDPQYYVRDYELLKIKAQTLWLWGNNDPFASAETCKRVNDIMSNSKTMFFENSGHLPWMDDPKTHAKVVQDFFQSA